MAETLKEEINKDDNWFLNDKEITMAQVIKGFLFGVGFTIAYIVITRLVAVIF